MSESVFAPRVCKPQHLLDKFMNENIVIKYNNDDCYTGILKDFNNAYIYIVGVGSIGVGSKDLLLPLKDIKYISQL